VLCGVQDNNIHDDYLELAYHTKGSIHTVEEDLYDFIKGDDGKIYTKNQKSTIELPKTAVERYDEWKKHKR